MKEEIQFWYAYISFLIKPELNPHCVPGVVLTLVIVLTCTTNVQRQKGQKEKKNTHTKYNT